MGNSGTSDLLLHMVKCWRVCAVNEENQALNLVLYCSHMMYTNYSPLGFSPIKHNEETKKPTMKYSTIYHISSKNVCVFIVFNMGF